MINHRYKKQRPIFRCVVKCCILWCMPHALYAQFIIPTDTSSPLYYQMGGSSDVSLPARWETNTINLDASLAIHPGYQCGAFNPAISLRTTLNQLTDAFKDVTQKVVQNATAAIAEFPLYELARANPTLYHIFNNTLAVR